MMIRPPIRHATPWARIPAVLHYSGDPTPWVRVTRPGQRLHSFLEGPAFAPDGALWLVDVPHGRVFRIAADGAWSVALTYDGEPHGLAWLPDGRLAIADYRHGLLAITPGDDRPVPLVERVNTERFRGPSDLCVGADGSVWFTDSGRSSLSDPTGRLFRLRPDGTLDLVLANVPYPNGVALSPDGRQVLLAVTRANAVWRLLADAPDPVHPMVGLHVQLSGGLGPDGLAVDAGGRLAIAHAQAGRAWLMDAIGDPLAQIRTPGGLWTTSVAFGPDGDALFIVDAQTGTVFRADLAGLDTPGTTQEGAR